MDDIAKGEKLWYELCNDCLKQITDLSKSKKMTNKKNDDIMIDEDHTYTVGRYGPVIKYKIGENVTFI